MTESLFHRIERLIRRDPGRRGLLASVPALSALGCGQLRAAADHLARHGRCVAIVTGFFVPRANPPAAETDGPPGALLLAGVLERLGVETWLVTDEWCSATLRAVADVCGYDPERLHVFPSESAGFDRRMAEFWRHPGSRLTHLISIERVGPAHTPRSLAAQIRTGPAPLDEFLAAVPDDHFDRCHNVRGDIIDDFSAPLHRLFEAGRQPADATRIRTIGIGDGSNEIGMGVFPWEDLVPRLEVQRQARIPCRIAADWTIISGTSNWGAAALAAGVAWLRGVPEAVLPWDANFEQRLLEELVRRGPAVDGVTARHEATVDGLPFLTYIQPWLEIRRLLESQPS